MKFLKKLLWYHQQRKLAKAGAFGGGYKYPFHHCQDNSSEAVKILFNAKNHTFTKGVIIISENSTFLMPDYPSIKRIGEI